MGFVKDVVQLLSTRFQAPVGLARARRISAVTCGQSVSFENMLFDLLLQTLGSRARKPTVTLAQELVDNIA